MKVINLRQEEQELIELAVEHNRHAQNKIYSKFSPKMLSVCRQYIKDLHQAEGIMITAFMKVFTNLKNFKNEGSFEGWIRRIMINECISYIRVQKKVTFLDDENYYEESTNDIETQLSTDDIQYLIDHLPEGYKMVFNLYVIEGYKHQEIATLLGISEGTSKSQLSHARKVLQDNIIKLKMYENGTE
ncbi:RNA polymerase sigma factor [Flavobacterium aciduliphilum]|uniref:RNA polymerase sigma-70 factor (ECF subfamily) n=1 Tax=Flavobacterium aciduliphilum TaxID=1101402 RepID=A0A328YD06_9FLAO|nr:RNA polymerase sigma factor [Flavobacterium aciduliphilum]RAR71460.1 RNA polymerase sigma-70 factor (ECF subfamily) [Flavobacterium aciduliphilum]